MSSKMVDEIRRQIWSSSTISTRGCPDHVLLCFVVILGGKGMEVKEKLKSVVVKYCVGVSVVHVESLPMGLAT
jgi:hypothetical protein